MGNGSHGLTTYPESLESHRAESTPRHPSRIPSLEQLARRDGPPLSTRELAEMTGMSQTFLRREIRTGHLLAVAVGRGRKRVFRIQIREARRYVKALGFLQGF